MTQKQSKKRENNKHKCKDSLCDGVKYKELNNKTLCKYELFLRKSWDSYCPIVVKLEKANKKEWLKKLLLSAILVKVPVLTPTYTNWPDIEIKEKENDIECWITIKGRETWQKTLRIPKKENGEIALSDEVIQKSFEALAHSLFLTLLMYTLTGEKHAKTK